MVYAFCLQEIIIKKQENKSAYVIFLYIAQHNKGFMAKKASKSKPKKKVKAAVKKKVSTKKVVKKSNASSKKKVVKKVVSAKKVVKPKVKAKVVAKPKPAKKVAPAKPIAKVAKPVIAKKEAPVKVLPAVKPAAQVPPKKVKKTAPPKEKKMLQTFDMKLAPEIAVESSKNEPKGKFQLEYVVHSSTSILFEFLSDSNKMAEWFADEITVKDNIYTFNWEGNVQQAKLVAFKDERYVRFNWLDKNKNTYFEFRIDVDELTGDVSLIITDFADNKEERMSSELLWNKQVEDLMHVIGSH